MAQQHADNSRLPGGNPPASQRGVRRGIEDKAEQSPGDPRANFISPHISCLLAGLLSFARTLHSHPELHLQLSLRPLEDWQEIALPKLPAERGSRAQRAAAAWGQKPEIPTASSLLTLPSLLASHRQQCGGAGAGSWQGTGTAAAAICSVMKQGAAMAPKGLVCSTNLPSTHFLLRILTPNLIVKSRIDWKMQMAI